MKSIEDTISLLNHALKLDPVGVSLMLHFRVGCSNALIASDLPLVVRDDDSMSVLGLLNGLIDDPEYRIAAIVDSECPDSCTIRGFIPVARQEPPNGKEN